MKPLAGFHDIHAHLAPGATDAPQGTIVSLTPAEARHILSCANLEGRFSVGIHPWLTQGKTADTFNWHELRQQLGHPAVVAVGECGLDTLRGAPLNEQIEIFRRQIELSESLQLPMILHIVKAIDPMLALRKQLKPLQPWIIHGFRGNPCQAAQLVKAGLYLSLGRQFNPLTETAIPADRLFRETDAETGIITSECRGITR